MHITPELEAELNAEPTTDKNKDDFSSFAAMLKARYGAEKTCNYEEAFLAWKLGTQAKPIETAVDKVLDGIDAAKVREQLIEAMNRVVTAQDSAIDCTEIEGIADELLKQFIITPRS